MTPRHPAFFGYGSLVNRATHGYAPATPVRLAGWRRVWRSTRLRPLAFLSAEPAAATIGGLVAAVPGGDWSALDIREAAYLRAPVAEGTLDAPPAWAELPEIYAVDPGLSDAQALHPILLSYLDTVVQGFLREFGTDGVTDFFATTAGWTAILDDRAKPAYPRHQPLTRAERALCDAHIGALGLPRRSA
ncbi:MAG: gamma-glutamylcyclotransferase [Defluviimonas sp.]|uniref:gamma-glutamylcyclotransferase family protein n=1 Tax=Albidovulum sp. TaxID=1872424 RepID=UPI001D56D391|nr:gamma-glutamylcyclotransferase [Paracoccaceae bacterium]MCC0064626.1 gamma-glutamylcyclotransferase [Defluviimonas sp.]